MEESERKCEKCGLEAEYQCPYCGGWFCSRHITPTIDEYTYGHKCEAYIAKELAMEREKPMPVKPPKKPEIRDIDKEIKLLLKYSLILIALMFIILLLLRILRTV